MRVQRQLEQRGNLLGTEVPPTRDKRVAMGNLGNVEGERGEMAWPPEPMACQLHSLPEASVFIFARVWVSGCLLFFLFFIFCHSRHEDDSVGRMRCADLHPIT